MRTASRRPLVFTLWLCAVALASVSLIAAAGVSTLGVALDTDRNSATGCTISTANGALSGIDQVATTIVTTTSSSATVARLERQLCNAGTLGAAATYDNGGWSVGFAAGTGGTAVVETSIPLAMLPSAATLRAVLLATN